MANHSIPSFKQGRFVPTFVAAFFVGLVVSLLSSLAPAQELWEYTPYKIRVWVAMENAPEFSSHVFHEIDRSLQSRAYASAGSTWELSVAESPKGLQRDMVWAIESVSVDAISEVDAEALNDDKIVLVSMRRSKGSVLLQVRQLDCRTQTWGTVFEHHVRQEAILSSKVYESLEAGFAPLARIERSKGRTVAVRLRAGGLIQSESSPSMIHLNTVLLPIVRNNDSYGQVIKGGVRPIPWTLLLVVDRQQSVFQCDVHSGMRNPISGRNSSRKERLALAIKARDNKTELRLTSDKDSDTTLEGYEIYARNPQPVVRAKPLADQESGKEEKGAGKTADDSPKGAKEKTKKGTKEPAAKEKKAERPPLEFLGLTDWRGQLTVEANDSPLRLVYVKNGGVLLARLPIVPGFQQIQMAALPGDDLRLQAEGFVIGLQSNIMDLVARREILRTKIRANIASKQFVEAGKLIERFRNLKTRIDLERTLDNERLRLTSEDRKVQAKIDAMFTITKKELAKHLDTKTVNQLSAELAKARGN